MDINPSKCSDIDFINFLIAASNVFSCTEAARCYPFVANAPSHNAFTRCLQRQPPDTEALWDEVKNHVKPEEKEAVIQRLASDFSTAQATLAGHYNMCQEKNLRIVDLQKQVGVKDEQIEKLNGAVEKQAVHIQSLIQENSRLNIKILPETTKKPWWKF